jgi:hypothetical protein
MSTVMIMGSATLRLAAVASAPKQHAKLGRSTRGSSRAAVRLAATKKDKATDERIHADASSARVEQIMEGCMEALAEVSVVLNCPCRAHRVFTLTVRAVRGG